MSIRLEHVSYAYEDNSSKKNYALKDVNLEIKKEEFIAVIGHTGSGKSTLIQHLNGLIKPTSGTIYFDDEDIYSEGYPLRELRGKVGICFQYPEHQLFETTILDDVCFGPMNFGKTKEEATEIAVKCLKDVGLPEKLYQKSPFELSGGQKRRVAIAGILAMEPEYFILDEPTAGLDPEERLRFYNLLSELAVNRIILLSTHIATDIEATCSKVAILCAGEVVFEGGIEALLKIGNDKIYTVSIPQNELEDFKKNHHIISVHQNGKDISCRFFSDETPKKSWIASKTTIEDSYMYLLSKYKARGEVNAVY